MKKILVLAAIFALVFAGCEEEADSTGDIGSVGPGGGTIFFAEGNQYMECSGELGNTTWDAAVTAARNHRGGGLDDWRLPNRAELDLMYKNLKQNGLGGFSNDRYWTSEEYNSAAYYQDFRYGHQSYGSKSSSYGVRAVRTYSTDGGGDDDDGGTTLTIRNESSVEIVEVIWNNVSFTSDEESIRTGTNVTKNVQAGSGYIFFKQKGNPIPVRTSELVVVEDEEQAEFLFFNNRVIREVADANNSGALTDFFTRPWIIVKRGNTAVNQYGESDFGSVLAGSTRDIAFTIENVGGESLSLISVEGSRVNLEENTAELFSIIQQPLAASLAPGQATSFTIRFSPASIAENLSASVHIKSNSRYADDFAFRVKGNGRDFIVGDTGPGGGMVFFVSGGQYQECSGELGTYTWSNAMQTAQSHQGGGFNNWRLPTGGELDIMYQNLHRNGLGDFLNSTYWSSTEVGTAGAHCQNFSNGVRYTTYSSSYDSGTWKTNTYRVRAVRSFTLE